jgi:hypothetical protein
MSLRNASKNNSAYSLENTAVKAVLEQLHNSSKKDYAKFAFRMMPYLVQKFLGGNPSFTDQYHKMADLSLQFLLNTA